MPVVQNANLAKTKSINAPYVPKEQEEINNYPVIVYKATMNSQTTQNKIVQNVIINVHPAKTDQTTVQVINRFNYLMNIINNKFILIFRMY